MDIRRKVEAIKRGHHACLFFDSDEERLQATVPYLLIGLERGERCLMLADDSVVRRTLEGMRSEGADVDDAIAQGRLVATSERVYLADGRFRPERTIGFLEEALKQALADGYSGLRATGDIHWEMGPSGDLDKMMAYETALDHFFFAKKLTGLCQYHRQRVPTPQRVHAMRVHPVIVTDGIVCTTNIHYEAGS
jgi:hypothetical protein